MWRGVQSTYKINWGTRPNGTCPQMGRVPNMRILVASGASGGHIFPALAFMEDLKRKGRNLDTLLVVNKGKSENYTFPAEYKTTYISASSVSFALRFSNILSILRIFKCAFQSMVILLKFRPDIVVGFGGYPSFFLVFFAHFLGIKTVLHEQNVLPGRANRFLSPFVDRIAISFIHSRDYLKKWDRKTILTGNLLRPEMAKGQDSEARDFFGFSENKFTILVMGGSQGSHKINTQFFSCLGLLSDKKNIQVIHLCGKDDFADLSSAYKDVNVPVKVFDFLGEMRYAYTVSDLAICRAGATTVSELVAFKIPAIIIPYPFAQQHQMLNARVLSDKGAAILLEDKNLNAYALKGMLTDLLRNRKKLDSMRNSYKNVHYPIVEQNLSDTVFSLL